MSISGERAYALMNKICFIRSMGTAEEKRAAEILKAEVEAMGLTASFEEFKVPFGIIEKEVFEVVTPEKKSYRTKAGIACASTPEGGITVPFVYKDTITCDEAEQYKGMAVMANNLWLSCEDAAKAGIACLVYADGKANEDEPDVVGFALRRDVDKNKVPVLHIGMKDALELIAMKNATVHIEVKSVVCDVTSQNVVVEIPGKELPEDIVVFGGHYDSVPAGVGASDNAGGSVIVMELLHYFHENPARQTLRFVWFGGEEEGLHGSKAYVTDHKDELEKIQCMFNVDVAGSIMGHNFVRATAPDAVAGALSFLADELDYYADIKQGCMGSDSSTFAARGVPAVGFGRGAAYGLEFAHSRFDLPEYCCGEALEATAKFVAAFARRVLDSKRFPIERFVPENVMKRVREIMGDEFMDAKPEEKKEESK